MKMEELINNNQETVASATDAAMNPVAAGNNSEKTSAHDGPDIGEVDEKSEPREHTRSKMALLFVLGFFAILFLCFAYAIKVNASITELKDILVAIIGALSGTLGFIVGFYYKSIKEQ